VKEVEKPWLECLCRKNVQQLQLQHGTNSGKLQNFIQIRYLDGNIMLLIGEEDEKIDNLTIRERIQGNY